MKPDGIFAGLIYKVAGISVSPTVWSPRYEAMGIFVNPITKKSGYLCEPDYKVNGYLCEPDFEVNAVGYLCKPDYELK